MISLLQSEAPLRRAAAPPPPAPALPAPALGETTAAEFEPEFEIVMGRRQIASVSLIVVVAVAVFSGLSYLVGRSMAPRPAAPAVVVQTAPAPVAAPAPVPTPAAQPAAPIVQPAASPSLPKPSPEQIAETSANPIFGEPVQGSVYMQVGAVEKGMATIWAEGLRTHAVDAFVAPGPNDKIFRVLVGPLPTPESYTRTKQILDSIGLATFGKKYQQ